MKSSWLREVWLAAVQSFRTLVRGKTTIVLLLAGVMVLVGMLACMDEEKEEKSKIRIGISDEDRSELSQTVVAGMKQMELYEVTEGTTEDLVAMLEKGELSAVCVLRNKYASYVERGRTKNLVTIYEAEKGEALLVGDVLAGVMMYEICVAKGYDTLTEYQEDTGRGKTLSLEQYREYVEDIAGTEDIEFSFDTQYIAVSGEETARPGQSLIYQQAIFAVFALMTGLLAMYAVLPFRRMRYGNLAAKIKTLPIRESALYAGSAISAFLLPGLFGLIFLGGFYVRNRLDVTVAGHLLVCTVVYICVIVCMMLLAAYGIKSQTLYQMGMLAVMLIFGVLGLVSIVDGLLLPEGTVTWIPNGWYVRKMTEILNNMR